MQGATAVGVASISGTAFATGTLAQDTQENGQDGPFPTAIRVVHASPDAPGVDVYLTEVDDNGMDDEEDDENGFDDDEEDDNGLDDDEEDDNGLDDDDNGNDDNGLDDDEDDENGLDDEEPAVEGVEFREVSNYEEVDAGTYRVRLVATEDTGAIEGLFEDDEEQVVFDQEVELEDQTTYTAVAYGEIAQVDDPDDIENGEPADNNGLDEDEDDDNGLDDENEMDDENDNGVGDQPLVELSFGEYEYVDIDAVDQTLEFREVEADDIEEDDNGLNDDNDDNGLDDDNDEDNGLDDNDENQAFGVELLEDDLTPPGDDNDVEDDDNGVTDDEEDDNGVTDDEEDDDDDNGLGDDDDDDNDVTEEEQRERSRIRIFHAVPDVDTLEVTTIDDEMDDENGIADDENGVDDDEDNGFDDDDDDNDIGDEDDSAEEDERMQEAQISPAAGSVYSGFALGYFDSEEDGLEDDENDIADDDEEDENGVADDDDNGMDNDEEDENGVADDNGDDEDDDNGLGDNDEDDGFEFVTVTDAEYSRAAGGTEAEEEEEDDGTLPSFASVAATTDD